MRMCPHRIGEEIEFNDSTDPNTLWVSTTWTQITDGRVTLASSSSHALGSTGGEETHTLVENEIPSHNHGFGWNWDGNGGSQSSAWSITLHSGNRNSTVKDSTNGIFNTGGGQAHNNMQPWRAVNRWRRVA